MSTEITIQQDQIDINVDTTTIVIESPQGGYPLPSSVYSVFGRVGNVIAQDGDYNLTQLGDVTISNPLTGQALVYNGTTWVNNTETYTGTVTSVNMSVPTGLTISGNPITTAGTLALGLASGYSIPTTASQSTWDTAYARSLTSASVTGTTTKTLTLNEQGGGTITATWSDYDTAPVTSVFGRTGAIVAQSGDYTTLLVPENTNLYFTNQRARYAISGDATSGVVYSNTTGIIALDDIPNTSLLNDSITINGYLTALGGTVTLTTTDVAEGTNLYYTQARFNSAFAAKTTTDLTEGTNLYFTNARAQAAITGTSPISVTSGNVSISQANSTTNGYLSSSDWISFNAKQAALTFSSPLVNTSGTISIPAATSSVNGYLTSTDWTAFNGKQAALSGTGFVKISGTTISYDNSTYLTTIEGITAGGELSGTYASPSLVNSAVTGKVLTGVNITGGTIQATDSILTGFGKLQNQINGLIGGSIYKGTWNASTNSPTLTSSVGTAGWYYIVNVAGSTNLNGITDWNVGDWAIFNGGVWQKVDNTDAVVSVNGFTGAVSLTTSNISEGTNLYYTDARARGALSAGTGISYNSSTGVITNSAPDQVVSLTGAGTTSISGTYPNFTITSNDQYTGTVTSVGITESSAALTITGSPVTTSGNINIGFAGNSTQYVAGDGSLVTFPTVATQAQNLVTEVYNETGATLTKGTVVYINGGHGNLPTITKALATSDATSAQTYGMVREDITNNNNGYVTVIGNLENIDTQAYAAGTQLYLSSTTAGAYTSVKQYAPAHLVYVGIVVRSHPTQGVIEVKIQNGFELDELHNVSAQSPNNGDILQYNSSSSLWVTAAGTTSSIAEGSNLYYTDARARAAVSLTTTGNNGVSTYNSTTGVLNVPTYTLAGLGGINLSSLSATSPLLYDNTTGVFSIQQANGSQAGYLSAADWTTFNSKQSALTNPVTGTGTTNYLPKFTGTSTLGNSLIYDNGSSVNVGGTSTTYRFEVTGGGSGVTTGDFYVDSSNNSVYVGKQSSVSGDNTKFYVRNRVNTLTALSVDPGGNGSVDVVGTFSTTRGTNLATATGSVGINTTTPNSNHKLEVNGATATTGINLGNMSALGSLGSGYLYIPYTGGIGFRSADGSAAKASILADNSSNLLLNSGGGFVGIGTTTPLSALHQVGGGAYYTADARFGGSNTQFGVEIKYDQGGSTYGSIYCSPGYTSNSIRFKLGAGSGNTDQLVLTGQGNVLIGTSTDPVAGVLVASQSASNWTVYGKNTNSSQVPYVFLAEFTAQTPNNTQSYFYYAGDVTAARFQVRGNGGIYNYSANNVNLSDISTKKDIIPCESYWNKFKAIEIVKFKYIDQSHDDYNIGVIAQQVEQVAPEFIDEEDWSKPEEESKIMKAVYTEDLHHATIKVLQEAMTKIEELEAKVSALENK